MSTSDIFEVTAADTAIALGSGDVEVLATPRLLAWLEAVTLSASAAHLADGQTSVGVAVRLRHRRPTRVGGRVTASAQLSGEPGARLTFAVSAVDEAGEVVADGEIERAVVFRDGFADPASSRRAGST